MSPAVMEASAQPAPSIVDRAKQQLADVGARDPDIAQAERLNKAADEIQAEIPRAIPEAKVIPPKPEFLVYEDSEIQFRTLRAENGQSVIAVSSGALEHLDDAELKGTLAHEIAGHNVIEMNPGMERTYQPPNLEHVQEDMKSQGINYKAGQYINAPDSARQENYLKEMQADYNALRVTRDPDALTSALSKSAAARDMAAQQSAEKYVDAQIEELKNNGAQVSDDYREQAIERLRNEARQQESKVNPHPGDDVRADAIHMADAQLQNAPAAPVPGVTPPAFAPTPR